ncbi:beta-lactamase/transpeptidase-like protein [Mycena galopus ATCC 62051]|nr:beta-lactamase/transpeptidase-like protein [Mycena galopus ATCC 62051]
MPASEDGDTIAQLDAPISDLKGIENEASQQTEFPDGGLRAWGTVFGAFMINFSCYGVITSFGVFEQYYSVNQLKDQPLSTISWIGSLQLSLVLLMGCSRFITGAQYLKPLIAGAGTLYVFCLFMTSISVELYQFVLSQGLGVGIAMGLLYSPSMSTISHHFEKHRTVAFGVFATGASVGGTVLPIAMRRLLAEVGFQWALLSSLSILNALSLVGRLVPNFVAQRIGPLNILIFTCGLAGVLDIVWAFTQSTAGVLVFNAVFGLVSGAYVSVLPAAIAGLSTNQQDIGLRLGMAFFCTSFCWLASSPIQGALIKLHGTYWPAAVFSGSVVLAGVGMIVIARVLDGGKVVNEELSSYIQNVLQSNNFTGLSLAIVLPNGEVEFAAWGNRTEDGDPVDPGTVMNLGSCSKAFLSASLGILMQDFADGKNKSALPNGVRKFTWDTKMRDLLPDEWMTEDQWITEKASLKDLLSHATGLPAHDASYSPWDSPEDIVVRMMHLRAAYELRQCFEYTNQMYVIGAYVISKYSGLSYRNFVEDRILLPLGMTSSTLYPNRAFESGNFTQSWTPSRRRIPFFMPEHTADLVAGAGGVMSSAEDMLHWVKMLLNSGVDPRTNDTIIPRTTFDLATSAISVAANRGSNLTSIAGYGLGWVRQSYHGHELVQHNGGAPGVATIVGLYPLDGFGIVLLANTAGPLVTRQIARAIADRMLGFEVPALDHRAENELRPRLQLQIPSAPAIPPDMLAGFTGTYSNLGYGNFTLCSPLFPTSSECLAVIQDFRIVDSAAGMPTPSLNLYSAWSRFWGSHLRFSPLTGNDYMVELLTLYVDGYGVDRTPFEDVSDQIITARFMVEDGSVAGLALFIVGQEESWRIKKGGSTRDIADVWFDKL